MFAALFVLMPVPGLAAVGAASPTSVFVRTAAEDRLARRFESAVLEQFKADSRFKLIDHEAPGAQIVALPRGLGWERRLDWTSVSYQVRIDAATGRSRIVKGECWNWNLRACARQIVNEAAHDAGSGPSR